MFTIWHARVAFACAMVLAIALSVTASAAGYQLPAPLQGGPEGPIASCPEGAWLSHPR